MGAARAPAPVARLFALAGVAERPATRQGARGTALAGRLAALAGDDEPAADADAGVRSGGAAEAGPTPALALGGSGSSAAGRRSCAGSTWRSRRARPWR